MRVHYQENSGANERFHIGASIDCYSIFDVNKPGCEVDDLKGGVAGGSILRGVLKVWASY